MEDIKHISNNSIPNKFAAMNCNYIKYPFTYFLDSAVRYGFDTIELFGAMPHFYLDDVEPHHVKEVKAECDARELDIISFCPAQGAYPMNIAVDEEHIRNRTVRMLTKALGISSELGAKTMLVSPGFGYENQDKQISWEHSRKSLQQLGKVAKDCGVMITIEPLTPTTANLVNTSVDAARMIKEVDSPNVKSMMDIGVMNFIGETVEDYFQNLGDNLYHIHFTDGPGAHVALGDGTFPMKQYMDDIQSHGYKGTLSFEINDKRYLLKPDEALEKNVMWLKKYGYSE